MNQHRQVRLQDVQHGSFISPAMRMGLERSIFEPPRFIDIARQVGMEAPDRLTPLPFGQAPAVTPGQAYLNTFGRQSSPEYDFLAFLTSGFAGAPDPSDIDPVTGKPMFHLPSLFKSMSAPTRFLSPETVSPQMAIPYDPNGAAFDTRTARFQPYSVAPSDFMVDLYHRLQNKQ